jgi:aryl-alcohol dehydrogenase-like predicted oxidoreductase
LFFCHRADPNTPIEETVWAMNDLIKQGKILYWGTSEWTSQQIMEAFMVARQYNLIPPTMEQPEYNLFHRYRFEVEYARIFSEMGYGSTIWSPLASGVLSGKYNNGFPEGTRLGIEGLEWLKEKTLLDERVEKTKRFGKLADDLGATSAQLALAWCLKNPHVSTVITGASKTAHLLDNLKAFDVANKLGESEMAEIERIMETNPNPKG